MKTQVLVIPVISLLILVAILPGVSFCMSSSITSDNNRVTITGNPSESPVFGLYKDSDCKELWNGSAFGGGVIQVKKISQTSTEPDVSKQVRITVAQEVCLIDTIPVYLWVPESTGVISIGVSYGDGSSHLSLGATVSFTVGVLEIGPLSLDSSEKSEGISIAGGRAYNLGATLSVLATSQNEILEMGVDPVIDITISHSGETNPIITENVVNLSYSINGITVESNDHVVQGPISDSNFDVDNGTVFKITDSSNSFTGGNGKASALIKAKDDLSFYIALDIGTVHNSSINVTIMNEDVEYYNHNFTYNKNDPNSKSRFYIGVMGDVINGNTVIDVPEEDFSSDLKPFYGVTLTVKISELKSGNAVANFYIIEVPRQVGGTS